MPSAAATQFEANILKPRVLAELSRDVRLRPIATERAQVCCHASLAAYVAAWDTYAKTLPQNFMSAIHDPTTPKFLAMHRLVESRLSAALDKFNTPNWENTRNLFFYHLGYDPINDWIWPRRSMNGLAVRTRLNDILKVRHSFAHGYAMPSYDWNTSSRGRVRLTNTILSDIDAFFVNLVQKTDVGVNVYISSTFGVPRPW